MSRAVPLLLLALALAACGSQKDLEPVAGAALPTIRPAWPRTSSAASGFFFCGMIELPVLSASGRRTKPNGWLAQITSSSASRDKCSAHCAAA